MNVLCNGLCTVQHMDALNILRHIGSSLAGFFSILVLELDILTSLVPRPSHSPVFDRLHMQN